MNHNPKQIKKFHWFWPWQDEKEEIWLKEMAAQGWHMSKMNIGGIYTFVSGEPRDVVYRLDFITSKQRKELEDYLQLFRDSGWEHIGQLNGWQYFRKTVQAGEAPEIFTDPESKIQKYRRVLGFLIFFLVILLLCNPGLRNLPHNLLFMVVQGLYIVLFIVYGVCIFQLVRRINQLKRV